MLWAPPILGGRRNAYRLDRSYPSRINKHFHFINVSILAIIRKKHNRPLGCCHCWGPRRSHLLSFRGGGSSRRGRSVRLPRSEPHADEKRFLASMSQKRRIRHWVWPIQSAKYIWHIPRRISRRLLRASVVFCAQVMPRSHCQAGMVFALNPRGAFNEFLQNAFAAATAASPTFCELPKYELSNTTLTLTQGPTGNNTRTLPSRSHFSVSSTPIVPPISLVNRGDTARANTMGLALALLIGCYYEPLT